MTERGVPTFFGLCFCPALEKTESTKSWVPVFFTTFPPHVWDSVFFFRAEVFGLLSPSLPLICWSQGFGYGFLASYGFIICTGSNFLKTAPKKSNLLMKLYTTPPSILTLETWIPQSRLAFDHSARRLAVGPPTLGQTKSYSVQLRLPLAATIGPAGQSRVFFNRVRPAA